jgi:hypothetical protein
MTPFTASSRTAIAAAILSLAFGAGWFVNGWRLSGNIERLKRENAEKIAKGWETAEKVNRDAVEKYATDLAGIRGKPPVVVRVCTATPRPASGTEQPATGVADTGTGEDIAPTLTACLTELYRYRALSEVLKK